MIDTSSTAVTGPVFLTPLGIEAFAVRRGAPGAAIERIGMGPVRATAAAARLATRVARGRPLVLVGLGGGLLGDARPGDVIVGTSVHHLEGPGEIRLDGAVDLARALRAAGIPVTEAPIVSSPRILHGPDARRSAGIRGAAVVDMESYWCAALARTHTFAVCRVLSDTPDQELRSPRAPVAVFRALRVIGAVARATRALTTTTVESRSVEEADL